MPVPPPAEPTAPTAATAVPGAAPPAPRARPGGAPPPRGQALTRFSVDHRWWVLLVGALLVVAAFVPLSRGTTTADGIDELVGDSRAAAEVLRDADFGEPRTETLVVTAPAPLEPAAVAALQAEAEAAYAGTPHVTGVGEGALSADGRTWVAALRMDTPRGEDGEDDVAASLARTGDLARAHPGWQVGQVGPASVQREVGEQLSAEFRRAELLSIPLTLAVLLLAFGSLVSAVVPVVLGLVAVVIALGLTALVSRIHPVADVAASLTLLIGLAVGVDYALFVLRRARTARAEGESVRGSVLLAARTSGRAVVVSGATVVVSMAGMLVAGGLYTSLALGGVLVVAVAVLASATLLPAVLAVLGDRVEALQLPWRRRRGARAAAGAADAPGRLSWSRLAAASAARPAVALAAGGAVVLALAVPALGMRTALPGDDALPGHFATVQALQRLTAAFPDSGATADVVVSSDPADAPRVVAALERLDERARAGAGDLGLRFAEGAGPSLRTSTDSRVSVLALPLAAAPASDEARGAVDAVRADLLPALRAELPAGAGAHVGGVAEGTDLSRWMAERLPWVAAFVLVLTFAVVLVSFGSPALALTTLVLNAGSCLAAFGIVSLVFEGEWAEGLLDFTSTGAVVSWLPVLLLVVLFGLSMDYHVLVVSRVREEFLAGRPAREAVVVGVGRTAGVMTSAAAVMVAVFAVFGTMSDLGTKQLGVGLAAAVLLDATLVRGLLLPAALSVLGRRAHTGPRWVPALHG